MPQPLFIDDIRTTASETTANAIQNLIEFAPRLVLAVLVAAIIFTQAEAVASWAARVVGRFELFKLFEGTPVADAANTAGEGLRDIAVSILTVYLKVFAVLSGAVLLNIPELTDLAWTAGAIVTAILVGLVVIALTVVLASAIGRRIAEWEFVADTQLAPAVSGIVQAFLYLLAAAIILDLLGLHTAVLVLVVEQLAFGLALALAITMGVALGVGYSDEITDFVEGLRS